MSLQDIIMITSNDNKNIKQLTRRSQSKTFIGKCNKGFDFLGYHLGGRADSSGKQAGISLAKQSFVRMAQKVYWLYEQQGISYNFACRLHRYLKNWVRWAKAGLSQVMLPKEIHINLNKNIGSYLSILRIINKKHKQHLPTEDSCLRVVLARD